MSHRESYHFINHLVLSKITSQSINYIFYKTSSSFVECVIISCEKSFLVEIRVTIFQTGNIVCIEYYTWL